MHKIIILLIAITLLVPLTGCNIDLTEQGQKDRAIVEKVVQELKSRQMTFNDIIKDFAYDRKNKGTYTFKFSQSDLKAQDVWDWTFRLLSVVEKADGAVMSGRSLITIVGSMGKDKVVTGTYVSGTTALGLPFSITLEGSLAGAEVTEDWNLNRFRGK